MSNNIISKTSITGFLLVGMALAFQLVACKFGIDGTVGESVQAVIAAGVLLVAGKGLYDQGKGA